jgi:hypothetical protein
MAIPAAFSKGRIKTCAGNNDCKRQLIKTAIKKRIGGIIGWPKIERR